MVELRPPTVFEAVAPEPLMAAPPLQPTAAPSSSLIAGVNDAPLLAFSDVASAFAQRSLRSSPSAPSDTLSVTASSTSQKAWLEAEVARSTPVATPPRRSASAHAMRGARSNNLVSPTAPHPSVLLEMTGDELPEGDADVGDAAAAYSASKGRVPASVTTPPPAAKSHDGVMVVSERAITRAQRGQREARSVSLPLVHRPNRLSVKAAKAVVGGSKASNSVSSVLSTRDAKRARGKPRYAKQLMLPPYEPPPLATSWQVAAAAPPPPPPPRLLLTPPPLQLLGRITCQGWLRQQITRTRQWKWRWCALVSGQLRCFTTFDEFYVGAYPTTRLALPGAMIQPASLDQPLQLVLSQLTSAGGAGKSASKSARKSASGAPAAAYYAELVLAAPTREARARWARALQVGARGEAPSVPQRTTPTEANFDGFDDAQADEFAPSVAKAFSPFVRSRGPRVVRVESTPTAAKPKVDAVSPSPPEPEFDNDDIYDVIPRSAERM